MLKKSIFIISILLFILAFSSVAHCAANIPEKIRIGLYFNDPSKNINKAISTVDLSAKNGLDVGLASGDNFTLLFSVSGKETLTVSKDSAAYHVQIGDNYTSFTKASSAAVSLTEEGIPAFPAYNGKWFVWTGFYASENEAMDEIAFAIGEKLLEASLKVVKVSASGFVVGDTKNDVKAVIFADKGYLQVRPSEENNPYIINVNGTSYRGDIEIRRQTGSDMTVINIVDFEEYLYGVLPCEMRASSHIEALKAQAVAARTFAVKEINKFAHLGFNLCSTNVSQVYKGFSVETARTNQAVDETRGEIVTYNGEPASTYYFSSSGGRTEDVRNVWGGSVPYLLSVEDKYEKTDTPNYNWVVTYTAKNIRDILISRNEDIGEITGMYIQKLSDAGRVIELLVTGTKGERVYKNSACRTVFNALNSQLFTIKTNADIKAIGAQNQISTVSSSGKAVTAKGIAELSSLGNVKVINGNKEIKTITMAPTEFIFEGKGWGHAVGMSQSGAKGMAEHGFTYDEILKHYYTGVEIKSIR